MSVMFGYRYFLTIVDDCTRFTWVYLLKQKSDVVVAIPQFFNMVTTQFNGSIKCFRSDNAEEFASTEFFNQRGVLHQYSCVETPQQNSVVERKHQHLLNVARALFFQSRVPVQFWTDCITTATFLINRTPSPLFGNKTPYDFLYKSAVLLGICLYFGYSSYKIPTKSQNLCLPWLP